MAANEPNVQKWFVEYKQVLNDLGINSPEQIWSGDETGVQNIPKEEKVIVVKRKPAYQTVDADQGDINHSHFHKWSWQCGTSHGNPQRGASPGTMDSTCASWCACCCNVKGLYNQTEIS